VLQLSRQAAVQSPCNLRSPDKAIDSSFSTGAEEKENKLKKEEVERIENIIVFYILIVFQ
jgi:hypothetical protein